MFSRATNTDFHRFRMELSRTRARPGGSVRRNILGAGALVWRPSEARVLGFLGEEWRAEHGVPDEVQRA